MRRCTDKLGNDQQGHDQQESGMNLHVFQERHGRGPAQQVPLQSGEHEEGQPGHQQKGDDPLAHERQRVVGQVRTAQKLEERTPG